MRFFKALKTQGQQGVQGSAMGGMRLRQALNNDGLEGREVGVLGGV
jgi:hypothetical protein